MPDMEYTLLVQSAGMVVPASYISDFVSFCFFLSYHYITLSYTPYHACSMEYDTLNAIVFKNLGLKVETNGIDIFLC